MLVHAAKRTSIAFGIFRRLRTVSITLEAFKFLSGGNFNFCFSSVEIRSAANAKVAMNRRSASVPH